MTRDEVLEVVTQIIAEALRAPRDKVRPGANLFLDLDAESIDLVDIRFRIEERFGFRVNQQVFVAGLGAGEQPDIQKNFTVERVVAFVVDQLAARGEA